MQWLLREFEDAGALAEVLGRLAIPYSRHKLVPFTRALSPEPVIADRDDVVLFGADALWR